MFFAAAGSYSNSMCSDAGNVGYYWSSKPNEPSNANNLAFTTVDGDGIILTSSSNLSYRYSIRPVKN